MIEIVEGIVVSEKAYGETGKIIQVLTKEHGIIGMMVKKYIMVEKSLL